MVSNSAGMAWYVYHTLWHARIPHKSSPHKILNPSTGPTPTMVSRVRLLSRLGLLSSFTRAATVPNTIELALTSNLANTTGYGYFVNITIGTPGQLQTLEIDTGSSNPVVLASNASFCKTFVCDGGTLNSSASSTFEITNHGALKQAYLDQEFFTGDYFRDRVQLSMYRP
jgi:hypothetical protein